MSIDDKLFVLDRLYRIYDDHIAQQGQMACQKGCAHCCTRDVTSTSLEGHKIIRYIAETDQVRRLSDVGAQAQANRFTPALTTNQIASLCLEGKEPADEVSYNDTEPCPLLDTHSCSIYPARPFGCRCLLSTTRCDTTGYAQVDDYILTVNTVFMQIIEQLDAGGSYGNLTDILISLTAESPTAEMPDTLLVNAPMPALMIPPEHREKIKPVLDAIRAIQPGG